MIDILIRACFFLLMVILGYAMKKAGILTKEDGVARICFGLGTRTVDRAYARTFYLTNPNLRPEGTKPHEIVTHSQEHYDYVDLEKQGFASEHVAYTVRDIIKKHRMAQTYLQWFDDNSFHWIHTDTSNMNAPRPVFTFSELPSRCPKLFARIRKLLPLFEKELQLPVDMEFAYEASDDRFTLVQMRPLSVYDDKGKVEIPEVPLEKTILRGDRMGADRRGDRSAQLLFEVIHNLFRSIRPNSNPLQAGDNIQIFNAIVRQQGNVRQNRAGH